MTGFDGLREPVYFAARFVAAFEQILEQRFIGQLHRRGGGGQILMND
jgi:hypothetical protein